MHCRGTKIILNVLEYFPNYMFNIHHGSFQVTKDRKWKEVFNALNCPSKITGASFVLKKYYQSLLHNFEEVYYFRRNAPSVVSTGT